MTASALLVAAWKLLGQRVLVRLIPMSLLYPLSMAAQLLILGIVSAIVFRVIGGYQHRLQAANAELRRVEALRDDLVHMVVHDMKNPISVVLACQDLLGQHLTETPAAVEIAAASGEAARELSRMVTNLLDITQLEQGAIVPDTKVLSSAAVLGAAASQLAPLARLSGIELAVQVDPAVPELVADEGLLQRVLGNLVGNALKHAPQHSVVTLAASELECGSVEITVSDLGPGVPAELHAVIFEKFARGSKSRRYSQRDSGLGLAFCNLAVAAQGGRIGLRSSEARGATFYVVLPAAPSPA